MRLDNSAPDNSESGVIACALGFEDVSNSLSEEEGSILLIVNTLDFQEGELFVLTALTSFEASEDGLSIESKRKLNKEMVLPNWLLLLEHSSAFGLLICFFTHLYIIMIIEYI